MPSKKRTTKEEAKKEIPQAEPKKVHRSEKNRVIAGIAGGLGEFLGIDPTIIRIIFIILALQGAGVLLYLILWLIIPSQSSVQSSTKEAMKSNAEEIKARANSLANEVRDSSKSNLHLWLGIALVFFGVWLFLENFGFFRFINLALLWPVVLIILGIALLGKRQNG